MFGHATYLVFEIAWALPVLVVQWAVGYRLLWRHRATWLLACLLPTLYLCGADDLAIHSGIWQINPARTLRISLVGLPLEEAIFFLLTNLMVVQTFLIVPDKTGGEFFARVARVWRHR